LIRISERVTRTEQSEVPCGSPLGTDGEEGVFEIVDVLKIGQPGCSTPCRFVVDLRVIHQSLSYSLLCSLGEDVLHIVALWCWSWIATLVTGDVLTIQNYSSAAAVIL
jgi:hypothetical protein